MALDMFLQLDGIQGTSSDPNHKGAIDVLAYSWGESKTVPTGTGTTKPNLQDISLTVYEDVYSPLLFRACAIGTLIKTASLFVINANSTTPTVPYIQYQFTGVHLTSLSSGGSGGEEHLTDNITLDFQTIRFTVNNPPNPSQTAAYSKLTNKAT